MTRILTTMWGNADWTARTSLVDRRETGRLRYLWRFWRRAPDHDAAIVVGALGARDLYIDLIATGLLKTRRRRPPVVIADATWEVGSASLEQRLGPLGRVVPLVARAAIRLIDHPANLYCVLSTDELETFPRTWGIPRERVTFTPFPSTLWDWWDAEPTTGDYVFAGGESLRDHGLLLRAVEGLDVPVRIAAGNVPSPVPANVRAGRVSHDDYMALQLGCRLAVVALKPTIRSAGQQTYLNAMALGKPVIITEAPGVLDYVDPGRTAFVVPPDPDALRDQIRWVLDPANAEAVAAVAAAGRRDV
ncbi:MAG: glycosyl transferase group 1, partial [Actinomycetia bacterium]|nr:glycosyl transferase group 1 [Actinomycetes bacterium]